MSTPASDILILSSYISLGISVIITIITFAQLCVSPAYGSELKAIKYRFVNSAASICIIIETICAMLHYFNTSDPLWTTAFVISRAMVLIVLMIGAIMFVITTFNTLYQSKLAQQTAPWFLRFFLKILGGVLFPTVIIGCIIIAIARKQIFWVRVFGIWVLIFPSTLAFIVMIGLIIVIYKMHDIRTDIQKSLKDTLDPNDDNASLKHDVNSDNPQKHGRARVIALGKKEKQLIIVSIILFIYWLAITALAVQRLIKLQTPKDEGTLYQEILDFSGYGGAMVTQFLAMAILMTWTWIKIRCKDHRRRFTVCYLCCMGESDPDMREQKSFSNLLAGKGSKNNAAQVGDDTKGDTTGNEVSAFKSDDDDVGQLVPMVSFPHNRENSKYIQVKICIINIEVLFFSVDILNDFMTKKNFDVSRADKEEIIDAYLGGQAYYNELRSNLENWYNKQCVFFIAHSLLKTEKLRKLLTKLDLLQYFIGDNIRNVLEKRHEESNDDVKVNWTERIIGRGSDYIELLKNKDSDWFESDKNRKYDKRQKEKQLLNSIHLMILEFIQIWKIEHDEILYVDHDESITKYMKTINVCKILKVNSHQVGKFKLKQQVEAAKSASATEQPSEQAPNNYVEPYELMPSLSIQLSEVIESGQHPIMNSQVFEMINNLLPDE